MKNSIPKLNTELTRRSEKIFMWTERKFKAHIVSIGIQIYGKRCSISEAMFSLCREMQPLLGGCLPVYVFDKMTLLLHIHSYTAEIAE